MNLLEETHNLVQTVEVNVAAMSRETGVSERWYYAFREGRIPDPRFSTLQTIRDYLRAAKRRNGKKS